VCGSYITPFSGLNCSRKREKGTKRVTTTHNKNVSFFFLFISFISRGQIQSERYGRKKKKLKTEKKRNPTSKRFQCEGLEPLTGLSWMEEWAEFVFFFFSLYVGE
jgi:hypothetical protein